MWKILKIRKGQAKSLNSTVSLINHIGCTAPTFVGNTAHLLLMLAASPPPAGFPSAAPAHIAFRMTLSRLRNSCDVLDSRNTDAAIGSRYLEWKVMP